MAKMKERNKNKHDTQMFLEFCQTTDYDNFSVGKLVLVATRTAAIVTIVLIAYGHVIKKTWNYLTMHVALLYIFFAFERWHTLFLAGRTNEWTNKRMLEFMCVRVWVSATVCFATKSENIKIYKLLYGICM